MKPRVAAFTPLPWVRRLSPTQAPRGVSAGRPAPLPSRMPQRGYGMKPRVAASGHGHGYRHPCTCCGIPAFHRRRGRYRHRNRFPTRTTGPQPPAPRWVEAPLHVLRHPRLPSASGSLSASESVPNPHNASATACSTLGTGTPARAAASPPSIGVGVGIGIGIDSQPAQRVRNRLLRAGDGHLRRHAPTGLRNEAQGCGGHAATLGLDVHPSSPTPTGLCRQATAGGESRNPVGVDRPVWRRFTTEGPAADRDRRRGRNRDRIPGNRSRTRPPQTCLSPRAHGSARKRADKDGRRELTVATEFHWRDADCDCDPDPEPNGPDRPETTRRCLSPRSRMPQRGYGMKPRGALGTGSFAPAGGISAFHRRRGRDRDRDRIPGNHSRPRPPQTCLSPTARGSARGPARMEGAN
jgi:hypothetical protein